MDFSCSKILVYVAWMLQLLLAITSSLFFLVSAILVLFFNGVDTWALFYAFATDLCLSIASIGIVYTTSQQLWQRLTEPIGQIRSELFKGGLAGVVWLWILLDAFFGPISQIGDGRWRLHRISNAATMILIPM
jgi:hypothetical protein